MRFLGNFAARTKVGKVFVAPTDVVLSNLDVVEPDLLFIRAAELSLEADHAVETPFCRT